MAAGRRREQRQQTVQLAGLVWAYTGDVSPRELMEFVERGTMPGGRRAGVPMTPEVAAKIEEYNRTGKLIVEPQDGT